MKKMLIVDDEPLARKHVKNNFPWQEWGIEIVGEAANGADALQFCEKEQPDIALVDITMPVMDGFALLDELKSKYPIKIVFLTAHRSFDFVQKALQKGADGYILKSPVNLEETKSVFEKICNDIDQFDQIKQKITLLEEQPQTSEDKDDTTNANTNEVFEVNSHIADAIKYIQENLEQDLTLNTISEHVYLSPSYFSRMFKKQMGISIIDYILNQRITHAKKLMAETKYRNYEIAEKVGFHNYSYFSTMFKKLENMSPNEYRNSLKKIVR